MDISLRIGLRSLLELATSLGVLLSMVRMYAEESGQ